MKASHTSHSARRSVSNGSISITIAWTLIRSSLSAASALMRASIRSPASSNSNEIRAMPSQSSHLRVL